MAYQKGLNKNRNHHDSLSYSGSGRTRYDNHHSNNSLYDQWTNFGAPKPQHESGKGKHSNGGRPKQNHW